MRLDIRRLVQSSIQQNCNYLKDSCSKQFIISSTFSHNERSLIDSIYKETIDFTTYLNKENAFNNIKDGNKQYILHKFDNFIARHGMLIESLLTGNNNRNDDYNKDKLVQIELFIKQHISILITLQHIHDNMKTAFSPNSRSSGHSSSTTITYLKPVQLCNDVISEVKMLSDLTYLVAPDIILSLSQSPESSITYTDITTTTTLYSVPSAHRFILFESLKNAVHATLKQYQINSLLSKSKLDSPETGRLYRDHILSPFPLTYDSDTAEPIPPVYLHFTTTIDSYKYTLTDSGVGIPPNQLDTCASLSSYYSKHMYNRTHILHTQNVSYQPQTSPFSGLGVGMFLCRIYCELLGGRMAVTSGGRGQGTKVVFKFPRVIA